MIRYLVNCQKISFPKTLGVSSYLLHLCSALKNDSNLTFMVAEHEKMEDSEAVRLVARIADEIIDVEEARSRRLRFRDAIELLPHHFQQPMFCEKSILICHDLHVFDIPWKYKRVEALQASFRRNLAQASAVVTHFPRTYYAVERTAGVALMNLFLTESPLLLDTRRAWCDLDDHDADPRERLLLYPAQLQAHKNHEVLIKAVKLLKDEGLAVKLVCPGSDFDPELTLALNACAAENGVVEEVCFAGRLPDDALIDLYRSCCGVIVPSQAEGGAYVPMEAIVAGKPVAVNAIDSARMHIEALGGDVIWFDSGDYRQTAVAIRELLGVDHAEWRDRNASARQRIDSMGWNGVAAKWRTIADWVVGRTNKPCVSMDKHGRVIEYVQG
jgi:glycosyltransferase involved in cell wall biosynthesis